MKLLTKEIRRRLPVMGSTSNEKDPMVQVKFFTPDSNWTWFGIEFDSEDIFFGYVKGVENELGTFFPKRAGRNKGADGSSHRKRYVLQAMPLKRSNEGLQKG